jgi:hypothetical protein
LPGINLQPTRPKSDAWGSSLHQATLPGQWPN